MKERIPLRSWLRRYWISMFLFLTVLYSVFQFYLVDSLTDRAEKNIQKNISIAENGIEDSLEIVDDFIYESLSDGSVTTASQLYYLLQNETDPLERSMAEKSVIASLQSIVSWSEMIDFILLYSDRNGGSVWLEAGQSENYTVRRSLKKYVNDMIASGETENLQRYMIFRENTGNYMIRLMKIEECYFIVCVSKEKILQTIQSAEYMGECIAFAADENGEIIDTNVPVDNILSIEQEGCYIRIGDKHYLQTGYTSDKTGYYFGMLTDKEGIVEEMWSFRIAFLVLFMILLVAVPVTFYFIHIYVERPLEKIVNAMHKIEEGDLDTTVEEYSKIREFELLVHSFNQMIGKVKQLKIEKYEVKLEVQKATMQYLQLQIKPHFYSNVLNIVYALAERKDYDTIQRMAKAIVNFSRYMFHDANELVELQRELAHVHYYMEIQDIRYCTQITCQVNVPDQLLCALVPPFIIQSFVENSVKYAFSTKKNCLVAIDVKTDATREYLIIQIKDNGIGYQTQQLNHDWMQQKEDGHIGLFNVYKRLKLIYQEKADINLSNSNGAVAVIKIPYIAIDNVELDEEV